MKKLETQAEIQAFLVEKLALALRTTPEKINVNEPLAVYGLDSLEAMTVMGQLSERCGYEFDFDVLWDYPTIAAVTEYVVNEMKTNP